MRSGQLRTPLTAAKEKPMLNVILCWHRYHQKWPQAGEEAVSTQHVTNKPNTNIKKYSDDYLMINSLLVKHISCKESLVKMCGICFVVLIYRGSVCLLTSQCLSEFEANAVKCCGHLWHDMKRAEHRLHVCWLFYDVTSCRDKPLTHAWKHTQEVVCSLLANIIYWSYWSGHSSSATSDEFDMANVIGSLS